MNIDRDIFFGQLALERGFIDSDLLAKALSELTTRVQSGRISSLGEVCIDLGFITKFQNQKLSDETFTCNLFCPSEKCGVRYNTSSFSLKQRYRCQKCGTEILIDFDPNKEGTIFLSPEATQLMEIDTIGMSVIKSDDFLDAEATQMVGMSLESLMKSSEQETKNKPRSESGRLDLGLSKDEIDRLKNHMRGSGRG